MSQSQHADPDHPDEADDGLSAPEEDAADGLPGMSDVCDPGEPIGE